MPRSIGLNLAVDRATVDSAVTELRGSSLEALDTERTSIEGILAAAFEQSGDDIDLAKVETDDIKGTVKEKAEKIVDLNSRLTGIEELSQETRNLADIRDGIQDRNRPGEGDNSQQGQRRPRRVSDLMYAQLSEESIDLSQQLGGHRGAVQFNLDQMDPRDYLSATILTSAGWDPFVTRQPGFVPAISRPIQILDTLPMSMTDQHSLKYMMQTTRGVTAIVEKDEGTQSGEAEFVWTEVAEAIEEIPAHIPISEIQLEDEPQIRAVVDEDLRLAVLQRADGQVLNGTGVSPLIRGFLIARGTQAVTDYDWSVTTTKRDDQMGDLRKAKTKCRLAGRCMPNVYYIHDNIWDEVALKDTGGSGYYLGSPATDFVEKLWGLPVVPTDHLSDADASDSNGAVVADTMYIRLWVRRGIHSEIGWNADDFTKRLLTIRAAVRLGVQVRRPMAICKLNMP